MQALAMAIGAGAAYTEQNKADLLDYNWTDIAALRALMPALLAAVCDQAERDLGALTGGLASQGPI
jgi:hypothetical protein